MSNLFHGTLNSIKMTVPDGDCDGGTHKMVNEITVDITSDTSGIFNCVAASVTLASPFTLCGMYRMYTQALYGYGYPSPTKLHGRLSQVIASPDRRAPGTAASNGWVVCLQPYYGFGTTASNVSMPNYVAASLGTCASLRPTYQHFPIGTIYQAPRIDEDLVLSCTAMASGPANRATIKIRLIPDN